MARGVNKAILIGNLGYDPETRYSQSGMAITSVSLATNETWRDRNTGEQQTRTEWHRITFFGKLAEVAGEYLSAGSKIYVEGRIQTDRYTDRNEIERFSTKIIANEMQMLDSRGGSGGQRQPAGQDRNQSPRQQANQGNQSVSDNDFDDDIPF